MNTAEQIIDGNRLIIESPFAPDIHRVWINKMNEFDGDYAKDGFFESLKYHTSFDWLMPVVEKISNTVIKGTAPFNSDQFVRVEIVPGGYVKISNLRDTPIFKNVSIEGSLISAVWSAVVAFIQWYSTQTK